MNLRKILALRNKSKRRIGGFTCAPMSRETRLETERDGLRDELNKRASELDAALKRLRALVLACEEARHSPRPSAGTFHICILCDREVLACQCQRQVAHGFVAAARSPNA